MIEQKGWQLFHGIHRGTITSRDTCSDNGLESLEACRQKLAGYEASYSRLGYVIWFAKAISPRGTQHHIHPGSADYAR